MAPCVGGGLPGPPVVPTRQWQRQLSSGPDCGLRAMWHPISVGLVPLSSACRHSYELMNMRLALCSAQHREVVASAQCRVRHISLRALL